MLIQERESATQKKKKKRGGIIPFWNGAPPEDSLRSWERREEKWGEKREKRKQTRGMKGQRRTDRGLDRYQSDLFSSVQIRPPGHGSPSQWC